MIPKLETATVIPNTLEAARAFFEADAANCRATADMLKTLAAIDGRTGMSKETVANLRNDILQTHDEAAGPHQCSVLR